MIEERMKSAMQNKLPDVPDGFDARSDMQLLELTTPVKAKRMKLSIGWVMALVLVCVLATGAVAATLNLFGLGDFISRYAKDAGITLPENIEESFLKEDVTVESEHMVYTVHETYYDEAYIRIAVTMHPKNNELLVNEFGIDAEGDIWSVYNQMEPETKTVAEYAKEHYDGHVAQIGAYLNAWPEKEKDWDGYPNEMTDFMMNEDGSVTAYYHWKLADYGDPTPEDTILLYMEYTPNTAEEDAEYFDFNLDNTERTKIPLRVKFTGNEKWVCEDEMEFPSVGVKVTRVQMIVTPLDVRCEVQAVVTDEELYNAQEEEGMLAFQFVTPDSTEPDGYKTVKAGLDGGVVKDTPEPEEGEPTTFKVHFSISPEAIGDHYALRAFNRIIRQKYETVEFTMKPLEEETQHPQDE